MEVKVEERTQQEDDMKAGIMYIEYRYNKSWRKRNCVRLRILQCLPIAFGFRFFTPHKNRTVITQLPAHEPTKNSKLLGQILFYILKI